MLPKTCNSMENKTNPLYFPEQFPKLVRTILYSSSSCLKLKQVASQNFCKIYLLATEICVN